MGRGEKAYQSLHAVYNLSQDFLANSIKISKEIWYSVDGQVVVDVVAK